MSSSSSVPLLDDQLPPQNTLLRMESVQMQFGAQEVLRGINLEIRRGETTVIIGESGCGKTVMLKLMIGLLRPTQGKVVFDDQDLARLSDRELTSQRLRFGYVFQGAALFDSLTVYDNIAFPLREHTNKTSKEIEASITQLLSEVGLSTNVLTKKPAELSGGQRKRVGLARALILGPEMVLYDEPTTGLDPIMTDVINELILQVQKKHPVTNVVVTHDMKTVMKVAERIIMLMPLSRLEPHEPQIIFDGTPTELAICSEPRVQQFVRGEARLSIMQ